MLRYDETYLICGHIERMVGGIFNYHIVVMYYSDNKFN